MDKKSIAIFVVACSFASSAFATSFVNKLITKQGSATPAKIKTHKMTNQADRSYTDFSGTWIPNCGNGQGEPTVIENDAEEITFDGEESKIGRGLFGKYESNEKNAEYQHTSLEWNADGSALIMKSVGISKGNTDNAAIQTDLSTFTLTMKNGQINLDGKWAFFEDLTPTQQSNTMHCVFTKKQ